jgi:hypothetical protein
MNIISKVGLQQMTVGDLIDELKRSPPENSLVFDFCRYAPMGWGSYRGYYEDMALIPRKEDRTVKDFLAEMKEAIGKKMTGYKGGDYVVQRATPVWVSEHGNADGTYVSGIVRDRWGSTVLKTDIDVS